MKEEQKELPAPARSRYKFIKIMTISLFFLVLFLSIGTIGVESTSSSSFCKTCHEMKPEYYTWKASTHSEVECANCHIGSGIKNLAKAKANGLVQVYEKTTNSYSAPIQMPTEIPNSACEKCHNMATRQVTPGGDLIIPHEKHLQKDVKCVQCHSGVVHGDISDRNVTFKSDYDKWDAKLGKSMMSDVKFTEPKMETCIECHKARDVSIACKTCHTTSKLPKSHLQKTFKTQDHGKLAEKDVLKCNVCHQYMSDDEIKDLQVVPPAQQFLNTGTVKQKSISAPEYAKENTFCKKCHTTIKPPSHGANFVNLHGAIAKADSQQCTACHNELNITGSSITSNGLVSNSVSTQSPGSAPACSSCHPASHENVNFKQIHPIDISGVKAPSVICYTCHYKPKCISCHKQ